MQEKNVRNIEFSNRFDRLSVRKNVSVAQLARELGISRTMIYDIKNEKVPVTDNMIRKLEEEEMVLGLLKGGFIAREEERLGKHFKELYPISYQAVHSVISAVEASPIARRIRTIQKEMEQLHNVRKENVEKEAALLEELNELMEKTLLP